MFKDEFNTLDIEEKIDYINMELSKGKSVKHIREYLKIGEKRFQKFIRDNNFLYSQSQRQYVKNNNSDNIQSINIGYDKQPTLGLTKIFQEDLLELIDMKDTLKELVKSFNQNMYAKEPPSIIEVVSSKCIKIDLDDNRKAVRTTVRVAEEVLKEWDTFCKSNSEFSKTDLLSMSMKEYIEKYR